MMFQPVQALVVKLRWKGELLIVGRLALKDRRIFFEYHPEFLLRGLDLSPFMLPLKSGVFCSNDYLFDGLYGIFNDSLPDGWGRLLVDRKLTQLRIAPQQLTALDRLSLVGKRGMGALVYEPELMEFAPSIFSIRDFDAIAQECLEVLEFRGDSYVDELLGMGGSSAGARPKILISISETNHILSTSSNPLDMHNDWIVKFRSSTDPIDAGSIEYAYHLMAKNAGLDVPQAALFPSKKHGGHFGVKRFDREGGRFKHMHTLCGLIHADFRLPSIDYETVMTATSKLTKERHEMLKQFRNAAFNILSHNRDDHSKNFSFLMQEDGSWKVSPAYDLTFSYGPGGEHSTMVMKEGKNPKKDHLLKLAERNAITSQEALNIIKEVAAAVKLWPQFAKEAQVQAVSRKKIQQALKAVLANF